GECRRFVLQRREKLAPRGVDRVRVVQIASVQLLDEGGVVPGQERGGLELSVGGHESFTARWMSAIPLTRELDWIVNPSRPLAWSSRARRANPRPRSRRFSSPRSCLRPRLFRRK